MSFIMSENFMFGYEGNIFYTIMDLWWQMMMKLFEKFWR